MRKILYIVVPCAVLIVIYFYLGKTKKETSTNEKHIHKILNGKPKSFDPITCNEAFTTEELTKIYDRLFEYNYLQSPAKLRPELLTDTPIHSDDGRVVTFKLKKGILFSDDPCFKSEAERELTAGDVIYSLKRMADPRLRGLGYHYLSKRIVGLDKWRDKYKDNPTNYDEEIEGLKVIDKYTFEIRLTKIYPELLHVLSLPLFSIVSRTACEAYKEDIGFHPVGTGPFKMIGEYIFHGDKIEYIKNPSFRDKSFPRTGDDIHKEKFEKYGGRKLPMVDKVTTYIMTETSSRWLKFKNQEIDYMNITNDGNLNEILQKDKTLVKDLSDRGFEIVFGPSCRTDFILFQNNNPLFKENLYLRKAITLATDREGYNRLFKNGIDQIAHSMIAEGLIGYNPNFMNEGYLLNKDRTIVISKAKEYLAKAGYPNGQGLPELELDTLSTTIDRQKAELFKRNMAEIGVRIKVITNTLPELVNKGNSKKYTLLKLGWTSGLPEGYELLRFFYGPDSDLGANYSEFHDDRFDKYLKELMKIYKVSERNKLLSQANEYLATRFPCVFLTHPTDFFLKKKRLKNLEVSPFYYGLEQYLDIE